MRVFVALAFIATSVHAGESGVDSSRWSVSFGFSGACSTASTVALPELPSNYYGIEMVPTRRVKGTGAGTGIGIVTFSKSPYGVSVSPEGTYRVDVRLGLAKLKRPKTGTLTAWAAKDDLTVVNRLGVLDESFRASGQVDWNKFLLVVTLEPSAEPAPTWSGPVVMRGMSRSGLMHTLAGHGPFEKEPCAKYGF